MNFFKYYLGIIFLCVAAIIAARFLILTPETVALMYLDSKMYEEAMRRYEKMLAAGNRSGNVIIPLAKLYAQQGEIKRAVGLLVRYINRNPDLLNAEAVLSQIDKSATFLDEYGKLIERTPDFSSTNDVLLDLSSWYESVLQEQRQIEILAILAKLPDNKRTELNFNKLLTYYAVNSRFDGPSTFVRQLIINENPKESKKSFLSSLMIMVNSEQYQRAMILASRYLESKNPLEPYEVEKVADVFINVGQTRMAGKICKQLLDKKGARSILQISQYRIAMAKGDELKIIEELKHDFYVKSIKSKRIYEIAIRMALKTDDSKWLKDILHRTDIAKSTQDKVYDFAFYALKNRDSEMAEILKNKLEPETLRLSPCLNYIIKSAIQRVPIEKMVSQAAKSVDLDEDDKMQLGYIMFHYDFLNEALLLIKDCSASKILQFFKIRDLVKVIINVGEPEEFMDKCEKESLLLGKDRSRICTDMLFLLSAASGLKERLDNLIAEHTEVPFNVLVDAYAIAELYGQYNAAATLAEVMCQKNQKDAYRFFLATALLDLGDYTKAITLLLQLKKNMRVAEGLFLRAVARDIELSGYVHLSNEARNEIEPTLNKILGRGDATVTELKRAAVCLAALGKKEKAEQLYLKLCADFEFKTTDIDEFVGMCKRAPGRDVREWFVKQAETGKWEKWRRLSWLNRLGMEDETISVVERVYKNVDLTYLTEYLYALYAKDENEKLSAVLARYKIAQLLKLGQRERIDLIRLLSKTGHMEWARQLLGSFTARELLANLSPEDIAAMFISTNMEKEGVALLGGDGNPKGGALIAVLYLRVVTGNEKFVELWLDSGLKKPESVLINLYYFAFHNKRTKLALEVARRLFKLYDTENNRFRLAEALVAEKHYEEGIALISEFAEIDLKAGEIYLAGISGLAQQGRFSKESADAAKFLRICDKFIKSPGTTKPLFIIIAYALSNTGYHDKAKELFYDLALVSPALKEPFTKMYLYSTVKAPERKDFKLITELIVMTGKEDEAKLLKLLETYSMHGQIMLLLEKRYGTDVPLHLYPISMNSLLKCRQMKTFDIVAGKLQSPDSFGEEDRKSIFETLMLAGKDAEASIFYDALKEKKQSVNPSLVRRLGYYFANNNKYEKAIPIFFELAKENNTSESPDLSLLLSLPGISENNQVVEWLTSQAKTADAESQLTWLEYLNYIKHPEKVIEILKEYYAG